jgi:arginine decarboxylase
VHAIDPTKIVVSLDGTGADGFAVEADAYAAGVRFEMADRSLLVPLLHVGVADAWVDRLLEFLPASIERRRGTPRPPRASIAFTADVEPGMSPRDAFFAQHERVAVREAIGRICAETVTPYPPGIPALAPGEVVTADVIEALRDERAAGSRISYCSDPALDTLLVVVR